MLLLALLCLTFRIKLAYANEHVEMRSGHLEPYVIRALGNFEDHIEAVCVRAHGTGKR